MRLWSGLLLVAVALFFYRLGDRDLWSSHEARAAMNAASLLDADSGGLPYLFDGRLELQKPPLFYWLAALFGRLRGGVDEVAVRLPAALAAALVIATVWGLCAFGFRRPRIGVFAGLVLATSIHFPWLARVGRIDMPLALCVTVACSAFALAWRTSRGAYVGWLACAVGVLLKGPIALVLPLAVLPGVAWAHGGCLHRVRKLLPVTGLALVVMVVLPVFWWLELSSAGEFSREFFWRHNVERGLGGPTLRAHPWWLYGPYLLLYLLPYSLLLPAALWWGRWRRDRLARLGFVWLVLMTLVLSLARFKRADYLAPVYPGAALLLGACLDRWVRLRPGLVRWGVGVIAGCMVLGWVWRIEVSLPREEPYRDYRNFAALVRRHAPAPTEVLFFRTEAHTLSFRVGRPLRRSVEWSELAERLGSPGTHFVILPPDCAREIREQVGVVTVEILGETGQQGEHERPLVLLRVDP